MKKAMVLLGLVFFFGTSLYAQDLQGTFFLYPRYSGEFGNPSGNTQELGLALAYMLNISKESRVGLVPEVLFQFTENSATTKVSGGVLVDWKFSPLVYGRFILDKIGFEYQDIGGDVSTTYQLRPGLSVGNTFEVIPKVYLDISGGIGVHIQTPGTVFVQPSLMLGVGL